VPTPAANDEARSALRPAANDGPRSPQPSPSLALPPDSDLVMVETRFAPPAEDEEPAVSRPRRTRPAPVKVPDEPLQLVETRKEQPSP
jgi:hypothetical protein